MQSAQLARLTHRLATQRWNSTAAAAATVELPLRHSIKQPPRVCLDQAELQQETEKLLATPVGKLYGGLAAKEASMEDAYDAAYSTIKKVEYLQMGHSAGIPGSLYSLSPESAADTASAITSMQQLVSRMQKEGEMYMDMRSELSQESVEEDTEAAAVAAELDFAAPGATSRLYETLLDGMACVGTATPTEYFNVASQVLEANDTDKGSNTYTLPTHVTYNAALRGIARSAQPDEKTRDEAISHSFTLYNHLTHSLHLPRNAATIMYMLQIIDKSFPASRVKGNMSVTFWAHASQLGVVNAEVIDALKQVHEPSNGPEFAPMLEHISGDLPQKYRRFVNKYSHSQYY
eukprot:Nitzschia sp. Nitz4//scaffold266_size26515//17800//18840//NITZ4_008258-RA/size26515-processed-gene-0.22-mRNA-1//1//CDS//3329544871//7646//frame0